MALHARVKLGRAQWQDGAARPARRSAHPMCDTRHAKGQLAQSAAEDKLGLWLWSPARGAGRQRPI
eukprot:10625397-Alexandrium_andersonii.AAC.1